MIEKPHFPAPRLSLKFVLGCSLILAVALGVSFYVLARKQERLIMEQVEREARALFTQIVITRRWIADHGGVFVETLPWTKPSPYLPESEIVDHGRGHFHGPQAEDRHGPGKRYHPDAEGI